MIRRGWRARRPASSSQRVALLISLLVSPPFFKHMDCDLLFGLSARDCELIVAVEVAKANARFPVQPGA
jgi:hypothetical protein